MRRVFYGAVSGLIVLLGVELVLLFAVLPLLALGMGPELLPSLKVVLDMAAFAAGGWIAGRIGRPHMIGAALLTAAGVAALDLTPYLPLNVPWLLRLAANAVSDSRYLPSLLNTLLLHALMLGSLFIGAHLSRPREAVMGLGMQR